MCHCVCMCMCVCVCKIKPKWLLYVDVPYLYEECECVWEGALSMREGMNSSNTALSSLS